MRNGTLGAWMGGLLLIASLGISQAQPTAADQADEAARIRADIARLKRDVQRAEGDIRRTDSLSRDEQAAAAKNQDRWKQDQARREKENQGLSARVQENRAKIAAEKNRLQGYLNGADEIKAREKSLLAFFAAYADSVLARVETGLPWDVDPRRDRVLALKRDMEAGSASPEEAFSRLTALIREETKSGDEVAIFSRPLTRNNGEVVNAQILKLGNQAVVYGDDEGKNFGVLERRVADGKTSYVWREDLDFGQRSAVKKALAVKTGREAPQLVPLPVDGISSLSLAAQGGRP